MHIQGRKTNDTQPNLKKGCKMQPKKAYEYEQKSSIMDGLNNLALTNKILVEQTKMVDKKYPLHTLENYNGCLIGGAVGDALGAPIEFYSLNRILNMYGKDGINEMKLNNKGKAEITDDTQMTIFTADGLLKSATQGFDDNKLPNMNIIYNSYQDWLNTQYSYYSPSKNGWISNIKELYEQRAPGLTCTGSLKSSVKGSIEEPINDSKGCGGIMRVAPAGLMYYKDPELAFEVGARCAALTHGSPDAYLPAGFHSSIIANIVQGNDIETSIKKTIEILKKYENHENVLSVVNKAIDLAYSDISPSDAIRMLGEGWHGDEALAISIYCILKSPDNFEKAVLMAVNHDGDSDSTGSIVGNIMGTKLGIDKIPAKWKSNIELTSLLSQLAMDLYLKPQEIQDSDIRYPVD